MRMAERRPAGRPSGGALLRRCFAGLRSSGNLSGRREVLSPSGTMFFGALDGLSNIGA